MGICCGLFGGHGQRTASSRQQQQQQQQQQSSPSVQQGLAGVEFSPRASFESMDSAPRAAAPVAPVPNPEFEGYYAPVAPPTAPAPAPAAARPAEEYNAAPELRGFYEPAPRPAIVPASTPAPRPAIVPASTPARRALPPKSTYH